jgi:YHS domain-containing protein
MYRVILILVLLTLLYFLLRSAIRELRDRGRMADPNRRISDKDHMVQDPNCRVFVPKGVAVEEEIGGQTYFFCSRDCAKAFRKQLSA